MVKEFESTVPGFVLVKASVNIGGIFIKMGVKLSLSYHTSTQEGDGERTSHGKF